MIEAIVLITAPAKWSGGIVKKLKKISQIVEAGALYGDKDVFARVIVQSIEELDRVLMKEIQTIDVVESTRTHILIREYYWKRQKN
jgi:DNA-binding Lrp family transcriptional regulator